MKARRYWWIVGLAAAAPWPATPVAGQWRGWAGVETRYFPQKALAMTQGRLRSSLVAQPRLDLDMARGRIRAVVEPHIRIGPARDGGEAVWADVRELSLEWVGDRVELLGGLRTVFWGVTESQHLVDVLNQRDLATDIDGEDKLGQPMVVATWLHAAGSVSVIALPYFRTRRFPGAAERVSVIPGVNVGEAVFESGAGGRRTDWAVRSFFVWGGWDVGAAHFSGTGRDPTFIDVTPEGGPPAVQPRYGLVEQTSLDVQWTRGSWAWKLEALSRWAEGERHGALTAGFETTVVGVLGDADLGVLAEYLFDTRGARAPSPFQDDVFVGLRLAGNDVAGSTLLMGAIVDRKEGTTVLSLEAGRRVRDVWTVEVEARGFVGVGVGDVLSGLRRDSYAQIRLARHW